VILYVVELLNYFGTFDILVGESRYESVRIRPALRTSGKTDTTDTDDCPLDDEQIVVNEGASK
jgi:hypothetical protein